MNIKSSSETFWHRGMLLFAVLSMALLLVACAPVAPGSDGGDAAADDGGGEEVTLTISFPGDNRQETMEGIIQGFVDMKAEQGVTVNLEVNQPTDGYNDQVLLDFSAGVGPDVFSIGADSIPEFVSADYLMPITEWAEAWDEWSNFPAGMQEMPIYQGELYGVMYDTDTRLIYYRKDVFEEAGIEMPWEPTSWADILSAAGQIKDNAPDVEYPMEIQSGTVWGEASTIGGFFMLFRGADGTLLDTSDGKWVVESQAILDSFQFYSDVFMDGLSAAEPFMEPEPWVPFLQEGFRDGNVGIIISGSWMRGLYAPDSEWAPIENRDEVVGWTPMPAREPGSGVNGNDFVGMGGGWGWSIAKDSDTPELAWEFVQYMTSAESVSTYVNAMGSIPARSDADTDDEFMGELAESVLPYQSFRPSHPDYNKVSAQIQIATERLMLGEATAEEAMELFAAEVAGIVGEDNVKVE